MTKVVPNIRSTKAMSSWITPSWPVLRLGRQIWTIFLVLTSAGIVCSQIEDDFSVEFLKPFWQGDRDQYIINSDQELQLSADRTSPITLYTAIDIDNSYQWEFDVRLEFAPSASNRIDIALAADTSDLLVANGLFIGIGENGSGDAIEVYTVDNGEKTVIARGEDGELASEAELRIKVVYKEQSLELLYINTLTNKVGRLNASTILRTGSNFFGWVNFFTFTRSDKFSFDNIYAGDVRADEVPPILTAVEASLTSLELLFSEFLESASVIFDQSLIITPLVSADSTRVAGSQVILDLILSPDVRYVVDLIGIEDLAGNVLDTAFAIIVPGPIARGELYINEVLFDPYDGGVDYVELYNNSDRTLHLDGLELSNTANRDMDIYIGTATIEPLDYAVLTTSPATVISQYPSHRADRIYQAALPRMSNDDGNITIAVAGEVIDAYDYSADHHQQLIDDVEGISLERISILLDSQDPNNWASAAANVGYGTPGLKNSSIAIENLNGIEFTKRQKVISTSGRGLSDELIIDYKLDSNGYIGTIELFDEYGNQQAFLFQNQNLATSGEIVWDGRCDNGTNCKVGIYILSIRLFHPDGRQWEQRITVGVTD